MAQHGDTVDYWFRRVPGEHWITASVVPTDGAYDWSVYTYSAHVEHSGRHSVTRLADETLFDHGREVEDVAARAAADGAIELAGPFETVSGRG